MHFFKRDSFRVMRRRELGRMAQNQERFQFHVFRVVNNAPDKLRGVGSVIGRAEPGTC